MKHSSRKFNLNSSFLIKIKRLNSRKPQNWNISIMPQNDTPMNKGPCKTITLVPKMPQLSGLLDCKYLPVTITLVFYTNVVNILSLNS
jgi:hypothetical protein